jgi:predicted PurR-regulated permease PerM
MRAVLKDKRLIAFIVLLILFAFLFYASLPFINAFFGALIVFVIFNPLNRRLKKKLSKPLSAWIIIFMSLIIIIAPLYFLLQGIMSQLASLPNAIGSIKAFESLLNLDLQVDTIVAQVVPIIEKSLSSLLSNTIAVVTNLVIFYFLLYYLLIEGDGFIEKVKKILPFGNSHKNKIVQRFIDVTKATIIGSLLIALLQGLMLWFGFYMLGLPGALFWGLVTAILSFIPIIGSPLIWGPASIILLVSGSIWQGVALIIWGIIISSADNVVRPITNKKFGQIHPLVSVIGVFVGIAQFGFLGIFVGPLILAYFILLWGIYKEEYLDNK